MKTNLEPGSIFDEKYRIEGVLGSGGVGTVYRALEIELNRQVAIKVLHIWTGSSEQADSLRRFKREAKVLCQILHPEILRVYRFGVTEGEMPFLVMEFVEGQSLRSYIDQNGPLSYQLSLNIAKKLAHALAYSHQNGIIHRDLKPENILVNLDNSDLVLKLIDFGLCKPDERVSDTIQQTLTNTGNIIGTPFYMSPEQVLGQQVDERTDIFSFASVFYEMLTGKAPFAELSTPEVLMKRINDPVLHILKDNPQCGLPVELDNLIQSCTSRHSADRVQNFESVLEILNSVRISSSTAKYVAGKGKGVSSSHVMILVSVILVILGFGAWAALSGAVSEKAAVDPRKIVADSLDNVQDSLKKGQNGPARKLADAMIRSESFKELPVVEKVDIYFKLFESFQKSGDDKMAQAYAADFFKWSMPPVKAAATRSAVWEREAAEIDRYYRQAKVSRNSWRSLAMAMQSFEGDKKNVAMLSLRELRALANVRMWEDQAEAWSDYCKEIGALLDAAMDLDDEDLFQYYLKTLLDISREKRLFRFEETAYSKCCERSLKRGDLKEAGRFLALTHAAYNKTETAEDAKDLKPTSRAKIMQIERDYELALAKKDTEGGNTEAATKHRRKAEELDASANFLTKVVLSERRKMGLKHMVNEAMSD